MDHFEPFHPVVREYFSTHFGDPTEVQRLAWPRIAAGEHVLATASTGSGKTLAAFLWAIDRLLTGAWEAGAIRVVYVSPLRALNTDVATNLTGPLEALTDAFARAGEPAAEVRVAVRSGDTPAEERARMLRRPPSILVTTPESLNILLTSAGGRRALGGVRAVILDEVHALVGNKRGVHLITAVERLSRHAGEVQRIALSATLRPAARVARWLGGARDGRARPVAVVEANPTRHLEVAVRFPGAGADATGTPREGFWDSVVDELVRPLRANRSTLVFANSRRMVEKLTRLVNEREPDLAFSHHGSLSREIRAVVEERLKRGELKGIIATSSLELGIDVGSLDEVLLVQPPSSVVSAVQRIGRSGHGVGGTSRGTLVPLGPREVADAAVVAARAAAGDIEEVVPMGAALDVLAQVVVSMTANQTWSVDELFEVIRGADPYRDLQRRQFDLVLEMLAGRYAEVRIRELKPVVSIDRVDGTVRGRPGAARLLYLSGGTIPDRGYFHLRVTSSGALLGELDEEFVWERSVGDTFTLGVQSWRIEGITHNDVLVSPSRRGAAMAPFWRAEEPGRSASISDGVAGLFERLERELDAEGLEGRLAAELGLDRAAAAALIALLRAQRAATGALPHRHRVVVEHVSTPGGTAGATDLVVHTLWGGRVNRPLAIALQAAFEERYGTGVEIVHDDDALLVQGGGDVSADELLRLVDASRLERLLRSRLESTGFFGARFREAAGRALLLPREGFARRTPLWLSRQRAKALLEAVARFDDFPVVLEAWRECLQDEFDLPALRRRLDELASGEIEVHEARTSVPSPLAAEAAWKRTNRLMYEDDTPTTRGTSLSADLLREVALTTHLRPRLTGPAVEVLRRKLQRTWPSYSPQSAADLLDLVVERVLIPAGEWVELLGAVERDGADAAELVGELEGKLARLGLGETTAVAAVESIPRILAALPERPGGISLFDGGELEVRAAIGEASLSWLAGEVLRFRGPVSPAALAALLGLSEDTLAPVLVGLVEEEQAVLDRLVEGEPGEQVCDLENLERLLRQARVAARPAFETVPAERLPLFLASWHGMGLAAAGIEDLQRSMERLLAFAAPAAAWEEVLLPARLDPYLPAWLDALMRESELEWIGAGERRVAFMLAGERDLLDGLGGGEEGGAAALDALLPSGPGRFTFSDLLRHSGLPSAELARRLWQVAWAGRLTSDDFGAVRQGIATAFTPAEPAAVAGRRAARPRLARWQATRPFSGTWYRLEAMDAPGDALAAEELARGRVRLLLDRYGVLFRELLVHEMPAFQWRFIFRTLRLMELSGEVIAGRFFDGVAGVQFAAPEAVRRLADGLEEDRVWWISAVDPISPCGLDVEGLPSGLPRRVEGSALAFIGSRPVVVAERRAARLRISLGPEDPRLPDVLVLVKVLLTRAVGPERTLTVETVNDRPAAESPYRDALTSLFHVTRDRSALRLGRRW